MMMLEDCFIYLPMLYFWSSQFAQISLLIITSLFPHNLLQEIFGSKNKIWLTDLKYQFLILLGPCQLVHKSHDHQRNLSG